MAIEMRMGMEMGMAMEMGMGMRMIGMGMRMESKAQARPSASGTDADILYIEAGSKGLGPVVSLYSECSSSHPRLEPTIIATPVITTYATHSSRRYVTDY